MKPAMLFRLAALLALADCSIAQQCSSKLVYPDESGRLIYVPDELGNTIPDFSHVGYKSGIVAVPDVLVQEVVSPDPASPDDSPRIQDAIDQVSKLPLDSTGFRGAVLLKQGEYLIRGTILVRASGVVLRGEGSQRTVLRATGVRPAASNSTLISVKGTGNRQRVPGTEHNIIDDYVPVGARSFTVDGTDGLNVGSTVIVHRPSTAEWIADIGMDRLTNPWQPGSKDINWDRIITSIDGNLITVDAPVTSALEQQYGGGTIYRYTWPQRIENVGIENMRGISDFNPKDRRDEDHAWDFIRLENVMNAWVRSVTAEHFAYAAVNIAKSAKWVTVDDSSNLDPISQITGGRRYSFNVNGQLTLVKNCYAREGRHDYVLGSTIPGPNVFVDSVAENTHADVGPHHRWSTGTLFDNIRAGEINIRNRGNSGTGHGWAGANSVVWNSEANRMIIQQPPTAQNWAIGNTAPSWSGDAYWESVGCPVLPRSLYYQQLAERMSNER